MKNTKGILWNFMLICMEIQFLGAQQLTASICFSSKRMMMFGLNASNAIKSTALTVGWTGIMEWHASNIKYRIPTVRRTISSWSLWQGKNSSNAPNASSGCKKIKDAIIWHASVNSNFATNVEVFMENVNVWRNFKRKQSEGEQRN